MRKLNILICLGLFVFCGCSNTKKEDSSNSSTSSNDATVKETSEAWNLVEKGFDKLITSDKTVHIDGVTQEIAHLTIDGEYNMLTASYEQYYDVGDIEGDISMFEMYGFMDTLDINLSEKKEEKYKDDNFGLIYIKPADKTIGRNEPTLENLSKIYIKDILDQLRPSSMKIDGENVVFTNTTVDGDVVEKTQAKSEITNNYYLDFLKNFKKNYLPNFGKRGKTDYRFLNDDYFDGSVQKKDNMTIVTFEFNKETSKYKAFHESEAYKELMTGKGAYNIIDASEETDKDDPLASHAQQYKDNVWEDIYVKPAFTDIIKSAKLEVVLDEEGFPISYDRLIVLTFDKYDITIPYFAKYTFERK